jgi:hypothetical protein
MNFRLAGPISPMPKGEGSEVIWARMPLERLRFIKFLNQIEDFRGYGEGHHQATKKSGRVP